MTLYLAPRIEPRLRSALNDSVLLRQLVEGLGSPLNIVLPEQIGDNVADFRGVYDGHDLVGDIFFAHKANRSSALIRQLAAVGAGIDVASLAELQHALGAGFSAARIMATGPKSSAFLILAARTGVIVNADSPAELTELASVVRAHALARVRVMVRLSDFAAPGVTVLTRRSRFGTGPAGVPALLDLLEKHADVLELLGMAYHVDTIGLPEKAVALEGCLKVLDECHRRGMRPRAVDIGGGFGVNYLADGAQWERYITELTHAVLGLRAGLTWDGYGYGLRNEGGKVRGAFSGYPAYRPVAGSAYLDRLLTTVAPSLRRPLGDMLLDNMYDLHIEPGRALLDQCGAVLASVLEVSDEDGDILVRLDLNAGDMSAEAHGVLMDPVLIGRGEPAPEAPCGVYLLGNLCLEADLITRRKVFLPARPQRGDLLAFVNTAGYLMDFRADHAMRQPVARTVAMYTEGGAWRWCLDELFWPAVPREGLAA